jgi:dUTP pyrophosphatase
LVEGLSEQQISGAEGAGFDLRLGAVLELAHGEAVLGAGKKRTIPAPVKVLSLQQHGEGVAYSLDPGKYVLVETVEHVNMPPDLVAIVRPRVALFSCGISLHTAPIHPGYVGGLVFGLSNLGTYKVKLEMGARFAHILFFRVLGETVAYEWGDKVTKIERGIKE